jgi:hypothetical protein
MSHRKGSFAFEEDASWQEENVKLSGKSTLNRTRFSEVYQPWDPEQMSWVVAALDLCLEGEHRCGLEGICEL